MRSHSPTISDVFGHFIVVAVVVGMGQVAALAERVPVPSENAHRPPPGWARRPAQDAGWRLPGGARIRALHEPGGKRVATLERSHAVRPAEHRRKLTAEEARFVGGDASTDVEVSAYVISNPPIDGFVPWIAVHATDKYKLTDEWDADPSLSVLGNPLAENPQTSYGVGLLDTGAGISVLGHAVADRLGLFAGGFNTGGTVAIGGVTGTVDAWVSQPLGLWITGFNQINPDLTLNTANMVGEWNVSVAMGAQPDPGMPDLVTAIGSPMAVYFASWIRNDLWRVVEREGITYQGPDITFHDLASPALPTYPNRMPLELRPTGAADVWFWPCFASLEWCPGGDGSPKIPSVILGASAQSLFFAGSVNLANGAYTANNRSGFMVDTGAQVTVISSTIAAQLGLDPAHPDFTVEIQGVDGQIAYEPGFFVDGIDIPATGTWLSYTNIPVVLLDVGSPEGGTLDGIVGMNLFTRYNLVLRGGGLPDMPNPSLDFVALPSIDADYDDDGDVDMVDFAYLQTCVSGRDVAQTDAYCAAAFLDGDADIDDRDIQLFTECGSGSALAAAPECRGL